MNKQELIIVNDLLKECNSYHYTFHPDSIYSLYNALSENVIYPELIINKWVYDIESFSKGKNRKRIIRETYHSLKKVDEETFNRCYRRYINPVNINIMCPTGGIFTFDEDGNELYDMSFGLNTIDDAWYGIRIYKQPYHKLNDIRLQIFEWVNSKEYINSEKLVDFGILLGGENDSY